MKMIDDFEDDDIYEDDNDDHDVEMRIIIVFMTPQITHFRSIE